MSFVPRVVTRNWRLKLSAFGLAVFLWAVVRAEPGSTNTYTSVPVRVEVSDLDWTLTTEPRPATVEVRFTGALRTFSRLGAAAPFVRVPLEEVSGPDTVARKDTVVQLQRDWVVADGHPGLVVQSIMPPEVRLVLERTRAAAVPLSLRTVNELPEGRALAQPLGLNPPVVRVRGPASKVDGLDSIPLQALDLSTVDRSDQYRLAVDTSGLGDLTFSSTDATVSVRLEDAVDQEFAGVPVIVDAPAGVDPGVLDAQPSTVDVTLRGGRTRVAQTDPSALRAVVPAEALEGMGPGDLRNAPLHLRGVPELVRAFSTLDSVAVRWVPPPVLRPDTTGPDAVADTLRSDRRRPDTPGAGSRPTRAVRPSGDVPGGGRR